MKGNQYVCMNIESSLNKLMFFFQ